MGGKKRKQNKNGSFGKWYLPGEIKKKLNGAGSYFVGV